jgi:hypothetical protein
VLTLRINRVVVGVVAMPVVIVTGLAAVYVQIRFFGILHWDLALFLAGASGCGVFLLADRLGVLAEPHAQKRGFLTDDESEERPPEVDSRPIVPR